MGTEELRKEYKIWFESLEEINHFEDLDVDGRII
jgi:hypothetical protein